MNVLPILTWPDNRLSTVCRPVLDFDDALQGLIGDMFDTMYDAKGRGLAAPQVGRLNRLFVIDVSWKDGASTPIAMVNPILSWASDETVVMTEGCLSIPGITTDVTRAAAVEMSWKTPEGIEISRQLDGAEARCALHELDHLDGLVTLDRLDADARQIAEQAYVAADE